MIIPYFKNAKEVSFKEVCEASRPYSKGFRIKDVAEIVITELRGRGVKVWR
jgi:hypothetical protein